MEASAYGTYGALALVIIGQIILAVRYEMRENRKMEDKKQRRETKLQAAIAGVVLKDSDSDVKKS